jgi:hypothetical protein
MRVKNPNSKENSSSKWKDTSNRDGHMLRCSPGVYKSATVLNWAYSLDYCVLRPQGTERQIWRAGQISCVLQRAGCAAVQLHSSQQQPSRTRRKMAGINKAFSCRTAIAYRSRRTGLERESASLYSVAATKRSRFYCERLTCVSPRTRTLRCKARCSAEAQMMRCSASVLICAHP